MEQDAVRRALGEKLMSDDFSCVAGKTGWRRNTVVHRHLGRMADPEDTERLHAALAHFAGHKDDVDPLLATFIATFDQPREPTEAEFAEQLWRQLQALHDLDADRFPWAPGVAADPMSPRFGFSVGGHGFFVVGLHANASRITRRFTYPTLVFNSHQQFETLKERGIYQRIQAQVRARELALQGSLNPNLAEFGTVSEAAQYAGDAVRPDWRCPFRPRNPAAADPDGGMT